MKSIGSELADHLYQVYHGGNWTSVNIRSVLEDISIDEIHVSLNNANSILTLVSHMHYYVHALHGVLKGDGLHAKDELSFSHPEIQTIVEWDAFVNGLFEETNSVCNLLRVVEDERWSTVFTDAKYGTWMRNVLGIIEHLHYHLGQIVILKKEIRA